MVFVPKANTVQIAIRGRLHGEQVVNTLYFQNLSGSGTSGDLASLGADILSWFVADMIPLLTSGYGLREVYAVDMSSETAPTATVTPAVQTSGGNLSPSLPNNVALCVSFRTAGRGRSSRGRNYISGLTEADVDNNVYTLATGNAVQAAYEKLLDAATFSLDWTWCVYSRYENGLPRPEAFTPPIEAVVLTDLVVDSQRRRLPGRGR
jgi:hypothetical protein